MILILIIFLFLILFYIVPEFSYFVKHPVLTLKNAIFDICEYFVKKKYNNFSEFGKMICYCAPQNMPFGSGKTLNMINYATSLYNKYNGLTIYDDELENFVEQKVNIISNVTLNNIPYKQWESENQIINCSSVPGEVTIFLLDEAGSIYNNRNWKNNLSSDLLNTLLQQRKRKMLILMTVQDFSLMDATLRKICSYVKICSKKWRFLKVKTFYQSDLERAYFNSALVEPISTNIYFATNELYSSYDTTEMISQFINNKDSLISNQEILNLSVNNNDFSTLTNIRRKLRSFEKK